MVKRNLILNAIVALSLSFLLFSGRTGVVLDASNRFFLHATRRDDLIQFTIIFGFAALAFATTWALQAAKMMRVLRIWKHLFLFVLVDALFSLQPFFQTSSLWLQLGWIIAATAIGVSFARPPHLLVTVGRWVCLIFSPLAIIVPVQFAIADTWGPAETAPDPFDSPDENKQPVILILFDGWSVQTGNIFELPHLAELAEQSIVFSSARSPSTTTLESIPSILMQQGIVARHPASYWTTSNDRGEKPRLDDTIFDLAKTRQYHTAVIGGYFPYGHLLGPSVDACMAWSHTPKGWTLTESISLYSIENLEHLSDPISRSVTRRTSAMVYSKNWYNLAMIGVSEADNLLRTSPKNTLSYIHLPIPHWPFVVTEDGDYFGHQSERTDKRGPSDRTGYLRTLNYVDRLIGKFVETLRATGKFEDALIIITSDHGAVAGGAFRDKDMRWVPLIIKLPGQQSGETINRELGNFQLREVIELALDGEKNHSRYLETIRTAPDLQEGYR